ncbi:MAG: flagellar export protein FliJ [Gammaproteobacteria bacterium]
MKQTKMRLELVKQVFAKRELIVAKELGEFQGQLDQAVMQLRQLRDHRDRQTASQRVGLSTDPSRVQNQQAFQQRLNEAINQQEQLIQRAEIERAEMRQRWLARRRKTLSVEKLSERRLEAERKDELARDQKIQDELSLTLGRNRGSERV